MKSRLLSLLFLVAAAIPAGATVTLNYQFGTCFTSTSTAVPDGTLWALIGDTNSSGTFTNGFATNASLTGTQANAVFTTGQLVTTGSVIGGDTVLAVGSFNGAGPGTTADTLILALGVNGAAAGQNFAFYWFPGSTFTTGLNTVGNEIGGINTLLDDIIGGTGPMSLGADGSTLSVGAATAEAGGVTSNAGFTAVSVSEFTAALIPEPSTALLGALSALGLLRRRRLQLASV